MHCLMMIKENRFADWSNYTTKAIELPEWKNIFLQEKKVFIILAKKCNP